jgi:hypothetical protein
MLSQALGLSPKRSNALLNYVLDQSGVTSSGRLAEGSLSEYRQNFDRGLCPVAFQW